MQCFVVLHVTADITLLGNTNVHACKLRAIALDRVNACKLCAAALD